MKLRRRQLQKKRAVDVFAVPPLGQVGQLGGAALFVRSWRQTQRQRLKRKQLQKTRAAVACVERLLGQAGQQVDAVLCAHSWKPVL